MVEGRARVAPRPRTLSGMERLWLVADRLHPPFVNQMVLEGEGTIRPDRPWPRILADVADAQPAARARLTGHLGWSQWLPDGPLPTVIEADGSAWDGHGPDGAPQLAMPLDPRHGPSCQIVVLHGSPARVVIRTHHALMDGQGTLLLARALFAVLRGESAPPADLGPLNDAALARRIGASRERIPRSDSLAPQGPAEGAEMRVTWMRRRIDGRPARLLPTLAVALVRMARPGPFNVAVPVDLRRHAPDIATSANLTGLLRLPMHDLVARPDPVAATAAYLADRVPTTEAAAVVLASEFGRRLPIGAMAALAHLDARRALRQGRYGSAAVLSNLGRVPLDAFSADCFGARRCFFIPPGNPGLPLFLAMAGDADGVELCATAPTPLATDGRLRALLDGLVAAAGPRQSAPAHSA